MTYTDWLIPRLKNSPYAPYLHKDLEFYIVPVGPESEDFDDLVTRSNWPVVGQPHKYRIPDDGKVNPTDNDTLLDFDPSLIDLVGTSWWNWRKGQTEGCYFDWDFGHGSKGLDEAGIARIDAYALRLPYVMNCTSKSGKGRHWFISLQNPLPAKIRAHHKQNCDAIMDKISTDIGIDLRPLCCSYGVIQYIYSRKLYDEERLRTCLGD